MYGYLWFIAGGMKLEVWCRVMNRSKVRREINIQRGEQKIKRQLALHISFLMLELTSY